MKKERSLGLILAVVLGMFAGISSHAQNIVPNPDLENYTVCPTSVAQIDNCVGWQKIALHTGSSDYINACNAGIVNCPANAFGNQAAHSGVGYFGFALYYQSTPGFREYTYCTFTTPMVAGTTYDISFWTSLSDNSQFGTDDGLELYFSTAPVVGTGGNWNPITTITPQIQNTTVITDKTNWIQLNYQYTATGGEQYMTIGNFKTDVNTNAIPAGAGSYSTVYLYVDDFVVEPIVTACDPAWTTTTACSTDPLIDLNTLITGDAGGTWSGTGVTGNMFDPSAGTQSITYTNAAPCTEDSTQTIVVTTTADASWTPPLNICANGADIDLNALITGTAGGTWTGTGVTGNMFDPSSGTQTLTYTVGTAPCDDVSAQQIDVIPSEDPSWTSPGTICETNGTVDLSTMINGTPGGTWSGTGVTGNTFDPTGLSGNISVTYTVGIVPCVGAESNDIIVNPDVDPTWTEPLNLCEGSADVDLDALVTGTAGGTWSGTGVTGNMFDPSAGTSNVTYTVGTAPCEETLSLLINVDVTPDPSWTTLSLCSSAAPFDLNAQITGDVGGVWSGTGITGSVFDPSGGAQDITYTVTTGACSDNLMQTITVGEPQVDVAVNNISCFGLSDGGCTATVTGGSGNYTYAWNPGGQTTASAGGLTAGDHTVTVVDLDLGCSTDVTVTVVEPAAITSTMTGQGACAPDFGTASVFASGGVGGFSYVWNNSPSTDMTAINLDSAMHVVTITDNNGCTKEDSILIQIFQAPSVNTYPDAIIDYGQCVSLGAVGANVYNWEPEYQLDCSDCQTPMACPEVTTTYCVTGVGSNGCPATNCMKVTVEIVCGDVFVPSGFSPNDDGENDELCVYSPCLQAFSISIYNRWGEKVFLSSDKGDCWDGTWKGKQLNPAVFVYVLEGELINGEIVVQKGNISLVR